MKLAAKELSFRTALLLYPKAAYKEERIPWI